MFCVFHTCEILVPVIIKGSKNVVWFLQFIWTHIPKHHNKNEFPRPKQLTGTRCPPFSDIVRMAEAGFHLHNRFSCFNENTITHVRMLLPQAGYLKWIFVKCEPPPPLHSPIEISTISWQLSVQGLTIHYNVPLPNLTTIGWLKDILCTVFNSPICSWSDRENKWQKPGLQNDYGGSHNQFWWKAGWMFAHLGMGIF